MSEWLPIETAPMDGTNVLLWAADWWHPSVGWWDSDKYAKKPRPFWACESGHLRGRLWERGSQPTHWQPLPASPVLQAKESK